MGYHRAGFDDIVGIDIVPQPHYPFAFIQGDAIAYCESHGHEFDVIHASPPCQEYSVTASIKTGTYPKLIEPVRAVLLSTGKPYIIENVVGAPLYNTVMLCGTMFGMRVIRHRLFETYPMLAFSPATCSHIRGRASGNRRTGKRKTLSNFEYLTIAGNDYIAHDGRMAMGIDWMTRAELSQAIPPAYTEFIGRQLLAVIK